MPEVTALLLGGSYHSLITCSFVEDDEDPQTGASARVG